MNFAENEQLVILGVKLTELLYKNTAAAIGKKVETVKNEKDLERQSIAYQEIINNLLQDREELLLISRQYKEAYESVNISDEDIEHLHNTLENVFPLLSESKEDERNVNMFLSLVNKDTLKTMQLLGFNYKRAIGEPLTESCNQAIKRRFNVKNNNTNRNKNTKRK